MQNIWDRTDNKLQEYQCKMIECEADSIDSTKCDKQTLLKQILLTEQIHFHIKRTIKPTLTMITVLSVQLERSRDVPSTSSPRFEGGHPPPSGTRGQL
jgi:hypothetical protein